ncbi:MAG: ATP synthase F1 subunit delta [Myxococcota bacterium]
MTSNLPFVARYAKAFLELSLQEQSSDLPEQLQDFSNRVQEHEELKQVLFSSVIHPQDKKQVVRALVDRLSYETVLLHFLLLLIDKKRISLLAEIAQQVQVMLDAKEQKSHAYVTSAAALTPQVLEQIQQQLERRTGHSIVIHTDVDTRLMGGVRVRIGDQIIDGSLQNRLARFKQHLLDQVKASLDA